MTETTTGAIHEGPLAIHPDQGLVLAAGRAVPLSVREVDVLVALAERRGGVVRRDELSRRVWRRRLRDGDRSIDVYVHRLRAKLGHALPGHRFIHTHVGFGYRLAHERSHVVHTGSPRTPHPVRELRRDP